MISDGAFSSRAILMSCALVEGLAHGHEDITFFNKFVMFSNSVGTVLIERLIRESIE